MKYFISIFLLALISCGPKVSNNRVQISNGNIVAKKSKLWNRENKSKLVSLSVLFLDGSDEEISEFKETVIEWEKYANLKLSFFEGDGVSLEDSDIRVTFRGSENKSVIGTGANYKKKLWSLALGSLSQVDKSNRRGTILHEFGHALGLKHEHQSPKADFEFNKIALRDYCERLGFSDDQCKDNYEKLSEKGLYISEYDELSIMHYSLHGKLINLPDYYRQINNFLSLEDRLHIAKLYPGKKGLLVKDIKINHKKEVEWVERTERIGHCLLVPIKKQAVFDKVSKKKVEYLAYLYESDNGLYRERFLGSKRNTLYKMKKNPICTLSKEEMERRIVEERRLRRKKMKYKNCILYNVDETLMNCPGTGHFVIFNSRDSQHPIGQSCYRVFAMGLEAMKKEPFCSMNPEELKAYYTAREKKRIRNNCRVEKRDAKGEGCSKKYPFAILDESSNILDESCYPFYESAVEYMGHAPECKK